MAVWPFDYAQGLRIGGVGREVFFAAGVGNGAFEPLDISTTSGFSGLPVPTGSGAFFEAFAFGGGVEDQVGATVGAFFIQSLGGAGEPLDVVATGWFFGFLVPTAFGAFFHFFAKAGNLHYQRRAAFGTFFVEGLGFSLEPLNKRAAFGLFGFFVPATFGASLEPAAGGGFFGRA